MFYKNVNKTNKNVSFPNLVNARPIRVNYLEADEKNYP